MTSDHYATLTDWYAERHQFVTGILLNLPFEFSPTWEQRNRPFFAAYDRLEGQRQLTGSPRLEWQDEVEAQRCDLFKRRDNLYKPMNDRLWPMCPLWAHLAKYQNRPEHDDLARLNGWEYLWNSWEEIHRVLRNEPAFQATLSPAHARSLDLLDSWWAASYCDEDLLAATRVFLADQRATKTLEDPSLPSILPAIAEKVLANTSLYHARLFHLFLLEFHPRSWEPYLADVSLLSLQDARYKSACSSNIQKLSWSAVYPDRPSPTRYHAVLLNDLPHQTLTAEQTTKKPFYLWDVEAKKTVVVDELGQCPDYLCISHAWGRWASGSFIRMPDDLNVPWPVPETEGLGYNLADIPEQLSQLGFRYVWIDLFCIPQGEWNSPLRRQEIAKQASIFKGSSRCIAWLHDVNSWNGVLAALDWIGLKSLSIISTRHAGTISNRIVDAFSAANVVTDIIRLHQIFGDEANNGGLRPSTWFSSLWTLQESVLCPNIELCSRSWIRLEDRHGNPIPLQALMALLRDTQAHCWLESPIDTPFSVPVRWQKAINTHPSARERRDDITRWTASTSTPAYPDAVVDLFTLCSMTRLDNVLTSGLPTTVLMNSDLRRCSKARPYERANAIMSAVGVTDWFLTANPEENMGISDPGLFAETLVLGRYPLPFLREAAQKFGAAFYYFEGMGSNTSRVQLAESNMEDVPAAASKHANGTMLPVSRHDGWHGHVTGAFEITYIERRDHETVSGWVIEGTQGNIIITSAGVVMSSKEEREGGPVQGTISCATTDNDSKGRPKMQTGRIPDMLQTLKNLQHKERTIWAVALFENMKFLYGILLEELDKSALGRRDMIKIGSFMSGGVATPKSQDVDWRVL